VARETLDAEKRSNATAIAKYKTRQVRHMKRYDQGLDTHGYEWTVV
jgi:hypothetical protein